MLFRSDLGLCLAVVSALGHQPMRPDVVAFGEVGLGGEVRQVPHASRRLAEAARLGFSTAIVPAKSPDVDVDIKIMRVATVREAMKSLGMTGKSDD